MNRRDALRVGLAAGITGLVRQPLRAEDDEPRVMTVLGPIPAGEMGPTLPHEHVLVDLPDHARTESADELAWRWLREWREGIEGTGIRPGFIKLGADAGPLPDVHRKLVRAAARTQLASGLTIAAHSGDGVAAMEALEILRKEGLDGSAFIWVHANAEADKQLHTRAAQAGAWVEFDGIGPKEVDRHVDLVRSMKGAGHLGRVLLSHDAGWYHVGEPGGGAYRPYDTLLADFVPAPEMLRAPRTFPAPGFEAEGVEALFYEGMPWEGKPTRVFAWIGMPKVEPGKTVPGIVLVHGGGGTAFDNWLRRGRAHPAIVERLRKELDGR